MAATLASEEMSIGAMAGAVLAEHRQNRRPPYAAGDLARKAVAGASAADPVRTPVTSGPPGDSCRVAGLRWGRGQGCGPRKAP